MKPVISHSRSIQDTFQSLKQGYRILLVALILTVVSCFFAIVYIVKITDRRVYIISPSQTYSANASYDHEVSIYEVRHHVKTFCQNIFSWDKDNYRAHIENALYLIDHSDGLRLFNTFKANEVYENLVSTSAKVSVQIDSIQVEMKDIPIRGVFYLTQIWQSAGGDQPQKIKASFELIPVSRSEKNPYGLQIRRVVFLEYPGNAAVLKDSISIVGTNP